MNTRAIRSPQCCDTRKCFGANNIGGWRYCRILETTYETNGECPFCKPDEADIVNAKYFKMIQDRELRYNAVAMCMGISPERFSMMMARPLSESNIVRLKWAIKELTREREKINEQ